MTSFNALDYAEQLGRLTEAGRAALLHYDLARAELQPIVYVNNAVFQVSAPDGSQYVLRLHRPGHKPLASIQSELIWLRAIRQHTTLQIPQPVISTAGDWLVDPLVAGLDQPLAAVLFRWIEGQAHSNEAIPLEAVRQAGELLARLHKFAAGFAPEAGFVRPRLDWEGLFGESSSYHPGEGAVIFTAEQRAIFAEVEARVRAVMDEIGESPDHFGLIHADFIAKNWLFNPAGAAALDFDDCAWGYYLYDLAPALLQFKYEARYADLRTALLQGYGAVSLLAEPDLKSLETLMAARHLASCRWLAGHLHHPRIRERAADLIAHRSGELANFLRTGTIDEQGRKEFF